MTDICMDVDTALSEVPVNVMPLIDDTDFKTIEDSLAYNASGMDLNWNFVTSAGAFSQTNVTPTTGGDYDWSSQGNGLYTIEIPASGGASINNDTEGYGWFSGFITGVLPWRGPIITFRAAALNDALIDGGDTLDVNVTAVSGDTTAADNIEADYDGTGYAKTNSTIGTATDVTNQVTANVTAISGDSTAADNLEADYDGTGYTANKVGLITRGTAQAGASSSITLASGYSATADDDLVGAEILLTGGTGADQSNIITAWNNTTKVATVVRAWATTPSSGTTYDVMGFGGVTLTSADVGDAVWDEALSGHTTAGTAGKAVSDIETDAAAILVDTGTTIPGTISTIDSNVDAILVDTGTTLPATLGTPTDLGGGATLADNNADMAGATFSTSTDSQEAIRNNQSAASDAALLQTTTIATLASQTSFTLTAGSADDDAYNNAIAIITDQSTSTQKAVGTVSDYTGSTKTVTLSADPAIFTMAVGDTIDIIAALGSAGSAPTAAAIADAVWDEALSGHTTAGTAGKSLADTETDAAAVLVDTAEIGAAGAGLTAVPWNASWDAEVQSEVTDALNAYDPPTKTEMDTGFSGLNDPTAAAIADAVLDEALSGHTTAGTLGKAVADIESDATDILADTNELQTDDIPTTLATLATASALTTVDTVVDAIKAKTDSLTFTNAGEVDANIQSVNDTAVTGDGGSETEWGPA